MAKIKFTKTELKRQQDAKKQYERFLPTLQLKKQQLQMEIRRSDDLIALNSFNRERLEEELVNTLAFFSDASVADRIVGLVRIDHVEEGETNIAGVTVPVFQKVVFAPIEMDYLGTEWFFDNAADAMRRSIELREECRVLTEQRRLLSDELDTTSQRVNLFEKVKLPECRENIRRIGIMLGDIQTSAVVRSKIAKKKNSAQETA